MRTFTVIAGVGLALTSGLLAGCGGTTDAAPPPPASTTSAPSPSTSPTAPVLPDAAKANSKAGAVAFVRFYIAAFNHAQATGDVSTLTTLGSKGCVSCNAVIAAIRKTYAAGGHSDGGTWIIDGQETHLGVGHSQAVYIAGHFNPSTTYQGPDAKPSHLRGAKIVASFFLRWTDGWKVLRWTRA